MLVLNLDIAQVFTFGPLVTALEKVDSRFIFPSMLARVSYMTLSVVSLTFPTASSSKFSLKNIVDSPINYYVVSKDEGKW